MKFDWRAKVGTILIIVLIVTSIYILANFKHMFDNKVTIKYPDGCVEIFINGNLNTTECTTGRAMMNQSAGERYNTLGNYGNLTIG